MRRALSIVTLLLAAGWGCEGHHDDLGQTTDDTVASSSTAGGGGAGGEGGSGGAPIAVEPDGPPRWTFVNGLVDRDEAYFCFLKSPADPADAAKPWPTNGIAFAHGASIDLPGAPVPDGAVEVVMVTGEDPDLAKNDKCRELIDAPPGGPEIEVISLGVLPEETADKMRSFLFAPTGCIGGVGEVHPQQADICGAAFSEDTPTLGLVVAPMSRLTDPAHVGFQIANVSSSARLDAYLTSAFDGSQPALIASKATIGQVAPFPASMAFDVASLGGAKAAKLTVTGALNGGVQVDSTLGDAMALGGLELDAIENGKNVVLVGVGATPSVEPNGVWYNDFAWIAVSPGSL